MLPAPFRQPVIARRWLLTLRTTPADACMSGYVDFNGFRLLVAQQPHVAVNEAHKMLHSIQDGFKLKMNSRFRL
jgi:hypothetical protein